MKARVLSAIIALPIALVPIYLGGVYIYVLLFAAMAIGLYEFDKAFKTFSISIYSLQILSSLILLAAIWFRQERFLMIGMMFCIISILSYYVMEYPRYVLEKAMAAMIAFGYVVMTLSHVLMIRQIPKNGLFIVWFILIIAFGSDTCAYLVGRAVGKHKLAPVLSPNKTIEGAIGAVVGTAILATIYGGVMDYYDFWDFRAPLLIFAFIGFIGSIISQFGDMTASAMKRSVKVKDFGKLLPGHGGILDRVDSIIFVAPFVYYVSRLILK